MTIRNWSPALALGLSLCACGSTEQADLDPGLFQGASSQAAPGTRGMMSYYKFEFGQDCPVSVSSCVPTERIPLGADFSGNNRESQQVGLADRLQTVDRRWVASLGGQGCFVAPGQAYSNASGITGPFELSAVICPTGGSGVGNVVVGRERMFSLQLETAPGLDNSHKRVVASVFVGGVEKKAIGTTDVVISSTSCRWQDIGASYDGATLRVYLGGQVNGSAAVGGPLDRPTSGSGPGGAVNAFVGGDCSTCPQTGTTATTCVQRGFKGLLDEVKISNGNGACTQAANRTVTSSYPAGTCSSAQSSFVEPIYDLDNDGLDDCVEEKLLDSFAMQIWRDKADGCPGPCKATSGQVKSDGSPTCADIPASQMPNTQRQVRVCRARVDGLSGVVDGKYYEQRVDISCAVLYASDCGLLGHRADIEPYQISLAHRGPGHLRSDRNLANWYQQAVETEGHQGTIAEVDQYCYTGDCPNIFAGEDKHDNHLGNTSAQLYWNRFFVNLEVGEPTSPRPVSPLGTDLGYYYTGWTGFSPWSSLDFMYGGAGKIRDKMALQAPQPALATCY